MVGSRAAFADPGVEMLINTLWHKELRILGPPIAAFGKPDLFFTKRLAMGFGCILFVRRTVADMAVKNDEGWPALRLPEYLDSVLNSIRVVCIPNSQNIPSVTKEPGGHVLGERNASVAFNCDVIVVVHPAEVVEP